MLPDPRDFIVANLHLLPAPSAPEIRLYTAHPASRVSRIAGDRDLAPYWAYRWAGGGVLARYILDQPQTVRGRRVFDIGSGSGIVAIAAAKAGALEVTAVDIDANAIAAIGLNSAVNGVEIKAVQADMLDGEPPPADVVVVGDLFYDEATALRLTGFLDRCLNAGIESLVGDPNRTFLPYSRLDKLAEYPTPDFGDVRGATPNPGVVYRFRAARP